MLLCACAALKSSCSASHDRPSVCRCSSSSRSAGVPGEASKSSQGSGGGEPRLSESFSMFIHPTLLLRLVQQSAPPASFCSQCRQHSLTPRPLTTRLSLHVSFSIATSVSSSQHLRIFPLHLISPPSSSLPLLSPHILHLSVSWNISISSPRAAVLTPSPTSCPSRLSPGRAAYPAH